MAGVPFENLERLATPDTAKAARELIRAEEEFAQAKKEVERHFFARRKDLSKDQLRSWRKAIRSGIMPLAADEASSAFAKCWRSAAEMATAESTLEKKLSSELEAAREWLLAAARQFLPGYLVFAAEGVRGRVIKQLSLSPASRSPRNKQARANERHLLLYLQRLAGKNDSLSAFGPEGWGTIRPDIATLTIDPQPGIARRETFLERWTAHGAAAALNADPETAAEIAPRLHPDGRIEQGNFIFTATGESLPLDPQTLALLRRCDGSTPAHSLGVPIETLRALQAQGLIRWEMEVPAIEPHAFDILVSDLAKWREGPVRARWLERLEPICALPLRFRLCEETTDRISIISEASERLRQLGARKEGGRFLYSAVNPIGEECFRECRFAISERLIEEVATEAAPWIDLWRDSYAFVAARVAAGLRGILEQAPLKEGALPLPDFLHRCTAAKLPLAGTGMVALAHLAFREVKEAFRVMMGERAVGPEYALTAEDCHFVRRKFSYPHFDECTYPSADLQLAAESIAAVAQGDYQWILAELHPSVALLHHGFFWSCPDKEALGAALAQTLFRKPYLYSGYFAADFTATTAVRLDALPDPVNFVAAQRSAGPWRTFRPAEMEVFVKESGDVGVRDRSSREYLGSFARGWMIPLGFHPFSFSLGAHTPRLFCGKVVVQREAWTITVEELGKADFSGISRPLLLAVEKLRSARRLPRYVYIRPTEAALRRSGVEGRDKDTKPVFIDLESYPFLEIFHRWLVKAGELEVTEMLPRPDQLLWQEADGRRTFEIRAQIVPG